ncbi:hypothetical protein ABLT88_04825 [Acinetobacter radioresistens]|uniref:hypothetical protein n=1 Tax=Acinetobacter radioresistens TaxID=40216 RepID=UPI0032B55D7D
MVAYLQSLGLDEQYFPDDYVIHSTRLEIKENFVMSRKSKDEPLTHFGDDIWDMSPYSPKGYCTLNFESWCEFKSDNFQLFALIKGEMKKVIFACIYLKSGKTILKKIADRFSSLRNLAKLAFKNACSIAEILTTKVNIFMSSFAELTYSRASEMRVLLKDCYSIELVYPNLIATLKESKKIQTLDEIAAVKQKEAKPFAIQTKLIPSRIYMNMIEFFENHLIEFNEFSEKWVEWFETKDSNPRFALSPATYDDYKVAISFNDARDSFGFTQLFEKHKIKTHHHIERYLTTTQLIAKFWIHIFSGMRDNEVNHLPANCYQKVQHDDGDMHVLNGFSSKINGLNHTKTYWMTIEEILYAVEAAKTIGEIYAIQNKVYDRSDLSQYPLFTTRLNQSVSKALKNKGKLINKNERYSEDFVSPFNGAPVKYSANFNGTRHYLDTLMKEQLLITEEDIVELENFDGFRDWRNDKDCQIGETWKIATHQFRRSLAVYSARSGMVSVGSLAVQFKHLSETMTLYYRKNSIFANNFVIDQSQREFLEDFEYQRLVQSSLLFEEGVINTSTRLFGGEGTRLQHIKDKGQLLKIFPNREETIKRMKKGELTYKPSLFGGCTNPDSCERISFTAISSCIDCSFAVFDNNTETKIAKAKTYMVKARDMQPQESPMYQQLNKEIMTLDKAIQRIQTMNID